MEKVLKLSNLKLFILFKLQIILTFIDNLF